MFSRVIHHGGRSTVTGSCHELQIGDQSILVDCGLLQGEESVETSSLAAAVEFPIAHLLALVVTHAHLDHVGRIPQLLTAGFTGPIIATEATARLLPLVIEDAVKVGISRDRRVVERMLSRLNAQLVALPKGQRYSLSCAAATVWLRFEPAGHVLGSAYVVFGVRPQAAINQAAGHQPDSHRASSRQAAIRPPEERIVFSGDLGAPHTPLLRSPRPTYRADLLVLESTYGDGLHPGRRDRRKALQAVIEHALRDDGTVLIPSFSLGRTQELLYEIEAIIHQHGQSRVSRHGRRWNELEIMVDSPLAARFTAVFQQLKPLWDAEARRRVGSGRHPLSFEQLYTIDSHAEHLRAIEFCVRSGRPTVVIAAAGMCTGGRIVDWLKALIGDPRTDVVFVGYQAAGTPGRAIEQHGPRGGYVVFDGTRYPIRAGIHRLRSYSAHADQAGLVRFARRMRRPPKQIRLVHGEPEAQAALSAALQRALPGVVVD